MHADLEVDIERCFVEVSWVRNSDSVTWCLHWAVLLFSGQVMSDIRVFSFLLDRLWVVFEVAVVQLLRVKATLRASIESRDGVSREVTWFIDVTWFYWAHVVWFKSRDPLTQLPLKMSRSRSCSMCQRTCFELVTRPPQACEQVWSIEEVSKAELKTQVHDIDG